MRENLYHFGSQDSAIYLTWIMHISTIIKCIIALKSQFKQWKWAVILLTYVAFSDSRTAAVSSKSKSDLTNNVLAKLSQLTHYRDKFSHHMISSSSESLLGAWLIEKLSFQNHSKYFEWFLIQTNALIELKWENKLLLHHAVEAFKQ